MLIRNSARALLIQNNAVLVVKAVEPYGECYFLPGGGQEPGENLRDTVQRECMEELGAEIEVGDMLFVREYIGENHMFAQYDSMIHQVEYIFICHLKDPLQKLTMGLNADDGQIGIEWLSLSDMAQLNFYPKAMLGYVVDYLNGKQVPTYIGDTI
ncbi:NUDIX domain-containing protein [Sporosarcina limicola]|uniref:ADP-ribose pyrophosphatase YjhB (NUDIX family) n=1 Tax=Sporosarcina limicola TaxID=34101 RepID=A0A927MEH4_9BACL|nr:NUDIX domain-containing protein [Sporosarcina limicola]MBE1552985.1 ADP-ribose pyrophosphatase YjhB (NUDIX family) [Sporosarcina limicola]